MNTVSIPEHNPVELLDIIDFKWLMTHQGHRVHVERLQTDAAYAANCLALAAASPSQALRAAAGKLDGRLGLGSGQA